MYTDRRGLRFAFEAGAELALKDSPKAVVPGRATELSLQGCFVETAAKFEAHQLVRVKICDSQDSFEAEAIVLYVRPTGLGLVFREFTPESAAILQKWMIKALDSQLAPL